MRKYALVVAVLALVTAGTGASLVEHVQASETSNGSNYVLASYSGELRGSPQGNSKVRHVDTPAIIMALKSLHANTYGYLVDNQPTDWGDLPGFLRAAAAAGINVRVVLPSPWPSVEPVPQPYNYDYVAWAHAIAELSLTYPNLVGMILDDFVYKTHDTFTVGYMKDIYDAKNAVNPNLMLLVGAYDALNGFVTQDLVNSYGPYIDGFWVAHLNIEVADLQYQLERIVSLLAGTGKRLEVVIYADAPQFWGGPFEGAGTEPTPQYVDDCLEIAHEYAEGVYTYALPLWPDQPLYSALYPTVANLYRNWSQVSATNTSTNLVTNLTASSSYSTVSQTSSSTIQRLQTTTTPTPTTSQNPTATVTSSSTIQSTNSVTSTYMGTSTNSTSSAQVCVTTAGGVSRSSTSTTSSSQITASRGSNSTQSISCSFTTLPHTNPLTTTSATSTGPSTTGLGIFYWVAAAVLLCLVLSMVLLVPSFTELVIHRGNNLRRREGT